MSIPAQVIKGHATANDFIIYCDEKGEYDPSAQQVAALCDRHRGIGGDGLIRLTHPEFVADISHEQAASLREKGADWFMDYRNADGSLAQMCGNGTRLSALVAQHVGLMKTDKGAQFVLGARAGVKVLEYLGADNLLGKNVFTVSMGKWEQGAIGHYQVTIPHTHGQAQATYADLGNPHVVSIVKDATHTYAIPSSSLPDIEDLDLTQTPQVEPVIEQGQNAEFVRIDSVDTQKKSGTATMRVNERGVGETLSCGTGLCASAIVLKSLTGIAQWTITIRGGIVRVTVTDDTVKLTGDSCIVGTVECDASWLSTIE